MKSDKNLFAKLFLFGLIGTPILFASTNVKAQANLQKAIIRHINKVSGDASEVRESRRIVYGNIDGDGTKDAAVQYLLEGFGGGNLWAQNLAVFLNQKGVYRMSADENIGGKFFRSFDLLKVAGKQIIGATETCPKDEPQGLCENPKKKQVKYVLLKGRLKEK